MRLFCTLELFRGVKELQPRWLERPGIPLTVLSQECPVSPAAGPEHDLCLTFRVFCPGRQEDVDNQILAPDSAQVDSAEVLLLHY